MRDTKSICRASGRASERPAHVVLLESFQAGCSLWRLPAELRPDRQIDNEEAGRPWPKGEPTRD